MAEFCPFVSGALAPRAAYFLRDLLHLLDQVQFWHYLLGLHLLDNLPFRLFLLLLWLLQQGDAEIRPFSGDAALLLVLLLHDALEALVPVSSLLPAAARRDFSPWLAAATAALETHCNWLHPAVLRRWHGSQTTTGLVNYWLAATGLHQNGCEGCC